MEPRTHTVNSDSINTQRIDEMCGGNLRLKRRLIDLFIEDGEQTIGSLLGAIGRHDVDLLKREAHKLKGSSANMGFNQLRKFATELEIQVKNGADEHTIADTGTHILNEFKAIHHTLEQMKQELPA